MNYKQSKLNFPPKPSQTKFTTLLEYLLLHIRRRALHSALGHFISSVETTTFLHKLLKMFATRALRQAAAHAERVPSIKFLGKRSIPCEFSPPPQSPPTFSPSSFLRISPLSSIGFLTHYSSASIDHTPHPHPASPTAALPADFTSNTSSSFSEYRDRSQQHGPLRRTLTRLAEAGIGGASAAALPSITPAKGMFFDRDELPARFRRRVWSAEEIEAVESGGASVAA